MKNENAPDLWSVVSPAARTALLLGAFFLLLFGLASGWILHEARRIKATREATRAANRRGGETGEMVWIPAGKCTMGGVGLVVPPEESPLHDVKLDGFWIDRTLVTNDAFTQFAVATGYRTVAEKPLPPARATGRYAPFAGAPVSLVFAKVAAGDADNYEWQAVRSADWRHPEGPGSTLEARGNHPVTQIAYADARAYAEWAGKSLPSEAEWEYAARGGLIAQPYVWGAEERPSNGQRMANYLGDRAASASDQRVAPPGTTRVGLFAPNGYGLSDMAGNVWEITEDWYRADYYQTLATDPDKGARRNPRGPAESYDPEEPLAIKKVMRGGSFASAPGPATEIRPSARGRIELDRTREDVGFRCVKERTP